MWSKDNGFGSAGDPSNQSLLIPNAVFFKTLSNFGLDRTSTQKLFISFTFLAIAVGFGLFSSLFSKNSVIRSFGLLVYVFNFYTVSSLGYSAKIFQLILMPPLFYFAYSYFLTKEIKFIFYNFIWVFVFQGIFTNLPLALAALIMYVLALLYYLFSEKDIDVGKAIFQTLTLYLSTVPVLLHHFVIYLTVIDAMAEMPGLFAFTAIGAPLNLLIQFRGAWWEKSGHLGLYYFNLWKFYSHFLTALISAGTVITVIISTLLLTWGKNREIKIKAVFWIGFYLFGIGLASGLYFLPGVYPFLMDKIPLMVMFRETWAKFIPYAVISVSAMVLVILDFLRNKDKRKFVYISLLLVLYLSVQGYPFISGSIIDREVAGWKRRLVKIPEYWEEFSEWTESNQKVMLSIPFGVSPFNSIYRWYEEGEGNSILPIPCVIAKTNVICINNTDRFSSNLKTFVDKKSFDLIKLGGVEQILFQDDLEIIDDHSQLDWQKEAIKQYIESDPIASFGGKLKVYPVKQEYLRHKIYLTQNVFEIERDTKISDLSIRDLGNDGVYVYRDAQLPAINKTELPNIIFEKISQTEYSVNVTAASDKFILVMNEAYNKNWNLMLKNQEPKQILVNGFANGWVIEPKTICNNVPCDFDFKIIFNPQIYFDITMKINIWLFLISMIFLTTISIKKIFSNKK